MSQMPMVSRPVRDSMLEASSKIAAAATSSTGALAAVREATLALEFHLDTLVKELSDRIEPRLLARASKVESGLREALVESWSVALELRAGLTPQERLRALAATIRDVAEEEIDLVFAGLQDAEALD